MAHNDEKISITLSKSESQSIHIQIYNRFKEAIESNLLKDGDRVPSSSVNACLKVHHSLRAEVHQFKTCF